MLMQLACLRLARQLSQLLTQHFLALDIDVLVPEKHDAALRDQDGEIPDLRIVAEDLRQLEFGELAPDDGCHVEGLIVVQAAGVGQGLGEGGALGEACDGLLEFGDGAGGGFGGESSWRGGCLGDVDVR